MLIFCCLLATCTNNGSTHYSVLQDYGIPISIGHNLNFQQSTLPIQRSECQRFQNRQLAPLACCEFTELPIATHNSGLRNPLDPLPELRNGHGQVAICFHITSAMCNLVIIRIIINTSLKRLRSSQFLLN